MASKLFTAYGLIPFLSIQWTIGLIGVTILARGWRNWLYGIVGGLVFFPLDRRSHILRPISLWEMVYELSRARLQATYRSTVLRLGLYLSHFRRRTVLSEYRSVSCLRLINSPANHLEAS